MCLSSADESSALKSGNADDSSALHRHPGAAMLCSRRCKTVVSPPECRGSLDRVPCSRRCKTVVSPPATSPPGHALASAATPSLRSGGGPPPACFGFKSSLPISPLETSSAAAASSAACRARIISTQAIKFRRYPKEPRFAFIPRPGGLTFAKASPKYCPSFSSSPVRLLLT